MKSYFKATRKISYSFLFSIPLLLLYETLAYRLNYNMRVQLRNGADVMLKRILTLFGFHGIMGLTLAVIGLFVFLSVYDILKNKQRIKVSYFLLMFAESIVYGNVLFLLLKKIPELLVVLPMRQDIWFNLVVALGAGIYEEFIFRFLLLEILFCLLKDGLKLDYFLAWITGIAAGSVIFSLSHYIGTYGDPWDLTSFLVRTVAGVVLSALYLGRGYGIAAYSHTIYDLIVVLQ